MFLETRFFKTGIRGLDSLGGLPSGEITEIVGAAGVGKSTLLHQIVAYVTHHYGYSENKVLYVDADGTFDSNKLLSYSKRFDYDFEILSKRILVYRPLNLSDFIDYFKRNFLGDRVFLVIDSAPNLVFPNIEDVDRISEQTRKNIVKLGNFLTNILLNSPNSTIIVANQLRAVPKNRDKPRDKYGWFFEKHPWSKLGVYPALGVVWSYFVDNRFFIRDLKRNLKALQVIFSRHWPEMIKVVRLEEGIIFK